MRLDEERESENYEIQRGGGGMGFGGGGGGGLFGMLVPLIASRFGLGGMVVAVIAIALFNGAGGLLTGGGGQNPNGFQGAQTEQRDLKPTIGLDAVIAGVAAEAFGIDPERAGKALFPTASFGRPAEGLVRA